MTRRARWWPWLLVLAGGCVATGGGGPLPEALYRLPYPAGTTCLLLQGVDGWYSHQGLHAWAFDFAMPVGSPVCAARDGVVLELREDSREGGADRTRYQGSANYVRILHADGTVASYVHLAPDGVLVSVGEHVRQGQLIAASGHTGWSTDPHLHFHVSRAAFVPNRGGEISVGHEYLPVAFEEVNGGVPLAPGLFTSANGPP